MLKCISWCVGAWLCLGVLVAQDFDAGLEAADAKIHAKEWRAALELLLALPAKVELDEDKELVAGRLQAVSNQLVAVADFEAALRARTGALAALKSLHGGSDHPDVAWSLNSVANCLESLGRSGEALHGFEEALAMRRRLHCERDHPDVATSLNNVAWCMQSVGRSTEALLVYEDSLAMRKRLYGERDHPDVATSLDNKARCLQSLGRSREALLHHDAGLAMRRRLFGDRDDPDVAASLNNVALCLRSLGRVSDALPQHEAALAMYERVYRDRDHPHVAASRNNEAMCLDALGRGREALPQHEAALAMKRRLYGDRDHPDVASGLSNLALCLLGMGRATDALPRLEASLAMGRRLLGERDHPATATRLNNLGGCLNSLDRAGEALHQHEQALAMFKRLHGDRDHPDVATSLNNVGACLESLGRLDEALPPFEASLAMMRRLHGDRDHPNVATGLDNVGHCLRSLGRADDALPVLEASLAMRQRLFGDGDHPDVATGLNNLGICLDALGRMSDERPLLAAALAMRQRLFGDCDHPDVARSLSNVSAHLQSIGRDAEALRNCMQACAMIERLREGTRASSSLQQSLFDELKKGGAFERLQVLAIRTDVHVALDAAERSRGRDLLDQLAQLGDPDAEAERRARQRGDEAGAARLSALRGDLEAANAESDRLLHELTKLAEQADVPDRESRRGALLMQSNAASTRLRQLLDERARLLGDVLPVGRVRAPADIQSALQSDELLLEFTVTRGVALLYVLAHEGTVNVVELPNAFATTQRLLPALLQRSSHAQLRGRDPEPGAAPATVADSANTELFASLIPASLWDRVRMSRRVFVAAHRDLHRVPFELLVTSVKDGKPSYWLDEGPPVSYVPSGTLLHWLRQRSKETTDDTTSLDLLAVGDPRALDAEPPMPEQGVFVVKVNDGGEGARLGLQPGDVLTSYDEKPLADDKSLRDVRMETEKAIEDGTRGKVPIPIGVWRRGAVLSLEAKPGPLGIEVGPGRARAAFEASLGGAAQFERITRAGDLERIGSLPPLLGARAETEAIEKVFADRKAKTKRLLGPDATEPAVFDLAAKAKYLHFACHGIAEEYAGQSFSMLVLSPPQQVLPGDDGLLKLGDLFNAWRGRLSSTRLVVLSACRTNVATTLRDEAPQALPIGFFFAGVPSVISSLWAVDDQSTRELMTDFYGRLLAGETDKLKAFTDAKKALRQKYPDPFHWAPFLFLGAPE